MPISNTFKKRLIGLIEETDLHKGDFAKAVGISANTISHATLYGILPNLSTLIKIADYLNIPLDYLLGKTDDPAFYPTEHRSSFHERLTSLTTERNTKFSKIARSMPFSQNLFYEWMRRKTMPDVENLYFLAEYFQVSADYLLGRTDYKD